MKTSPMKTTTKRTSTTTKAKPKRIPASAKITADMNRAMDALRRLAKTSHRSVKPCLAEAIESLQFKLSIITGKPFTGSLVL
jgi:hypothetical protein